MRTTVFATFGVVKIFKKCVENQKMASLCSAPDNHGKSPFDILRDCLFHLTFCETVSLTLTFCEMVS